MNNILPTLTSVEPSSIATLKEWLIPIESVGFSPNPYFRDKSSKSLFVALKYGRSSSPSSVASLRMTYSHSMFPFSSITTTSFCSPPFEST